MIVLSIDPGKTCGLALVNLAKEDHDGRLVDTGSAEFPHVYDHVLDGSWSAMGESGPLPLLDFGGVRVPVHAVVLEDTRDQPIHAKRRGGSRGVRDAKARAVGRIDAMIDLLEARCQALCVPVLWEAWEEGWDEASDEGGAAGEAGEGTE